MGMPGRQDPPLPVASPGGPLRVPSEETLLVLALPLRRLHHPLLASRNNVAIEPQYSCTTILTVPHVHCGRQEWSPRRPWFVGPHARYHMSLPSARVHRYRRGRDTHVPEKVSSQ
jgi:hypothetical protein